jgi:hypothetical protein
MTTFLDYHIEDTEITMIATMDDSKNIRLYTKREIEKVVNALMGIELVVVYERPIIHIYKTLEGLEHYLDDSDLRKRYYDLHTAIRKETGRTIALSKVAKSTLGLGPQSKLNRLEPGIGPRTQAEIELQMNERLEVLKQVFDYAIQNDQLSFEKHDETIWVELTINENPIHSGF